jgi:hypothetical protein
LKERGRDHKRDVVPLYALYSGIMREPDERQLANSIFLRRNESASISLDSFL